MLPCAICKTKEFVKYEMYTDSYFTPMYKIYCTKCRQIVYGKTSEEVHIRWNWLNSYAKFKKD